MAKNKWDLLIIYDQDVTERLDEPQKKRLSDVLEKLTGYGCFVSERCSLVEAFQLLTIQTDTTRFDLAVVISQREHLRPLDYRGLIRKICKMVPLALVTGPNIDKLDLHIESYLKELLCEAMFSLIERRGAKHKLSELKHELPWLWPLAE